MLDVRRSHTHVVRCLARPERLDGLIVPTGVLALKVAPDELLLIGGRAEVDLPEGLVVDETAGWAVWTLAGPDAGEALARLSALQLPDGFSQGVIAGVPAKAVVDGGEVRLLVAASQAHHVEERLRAACSDLLAS